MIREKLGKVKMQNFAGANTLRTKHFICLKMLSQTQRSVYFKLLTPHIFLCTAPQNGSKFLCHDYNK